MATFVSNARLADKISEVIPVQMTTQDIDENPEFANLLLALSQYVTDDVISVQVDKDLIQAQQQLSYDKHQWLQQHIAYQELLDLIDDYEVKGTEKARSSEDDQLLALLQRSLRMAEIGDYLDCSPDPSCKVTLLGLTNDDLQIRNPYKQHIPHLQQKFLPELEDRLRKKCENLVSFYKPKNHLTDDRLQLAKASQLPSILETDCRKLNEETKLLRREKLNRDKRFWLYYQALMDSLTVLEKLISCHRLKYRAEHDKVDSEWLIARCDAMCLKIRMSEMQLLCDTYQRETVKALKVVQKCLHENADETKKEYIHVTQTLKSYEAVGMGFDALVEEYSRLKNELDNKKWAINELSRSLGHVS